MIADRGRSMRFPVLDDAARVRIVDAEQYANQQWADRLRLARSTQDVREALMEAARALDTFDHDTYVAAEMRLTNLCREFGVDPRTVAVLLLSEATAYRERYILGTYQRTSLGTIYSSDTP